MSIKIYLADDHAIFRRGLRAFLEGEKIFEFVGEAEDNKTLIKAVKKTDIDVVMLDISMPGMPVSYAIKEVLNNKPDIGIVVLTMHEDEFYIREVFHAGAKAFIAKKSAPNVLINAIKYVSRGKIYIDLIIYRDVFRDKLLQFTLYK